MFPVLGKKRHPVSHTLRFQSCLGYLETLQLLTSWSLRLLACKMGTANADLGVLVKVTWIMYRKAAVTSSGVQEMP